MSDNENKVNKNSVENFDDLNMSNLETHSTPSASKDKTELNMSDQSMLTNLYSLMCSMKKNLEKQHEEQNNKFKELNSRFDINETELNKRFDNNEKIFENKFNVISSDMNSRFDTNDTKFDVLTKSLCSICLLYTSRCV